MRILGPILVQVLWILFTSAALAENVQAQQTDAERKAELRSVLLQARDAVIQLTVEDTATFDTSIQRKVDSLVQSFLYIGDRENVRYLQLHLKKGYADEIKSALEPELKLSGDELIAHTLNISSVRDRTLLLGRIAIQQHRSGNEAEAARILDLALRSIVEIAPRTPSTRDALFALAGLLHEEEFEAGEDRVLMKTDEHLVSGQPYEWALFAEELINVGRLERAREALDRSGDEYRPSVEKRLQAEIAAGLPFDEAVPAALQVDDSSLGVRALRSIAKRQLDVGDNDGARKTLMIAVRVALEKEHDVDFRVSHLADIAWDQFQLDDVEGASNTLNLAILENKKQYYPSASGWVQLADCYAYQLRFTEAKELAALIKDPYYRGEALGAIAYREAVSGHSADALEWVSSLQHPQERSAAFLGVTDALIERMKTGTR